jgi:hypothetical protein
MESVTNSNILGIRMGHVAVFSCGLGTTALILACVTANLSLWLSFAPIAAAFGWTQIFGPCGTAIASTLTPVAKTSPRRFWLSAVLAYTLGGLASSIALGSVLGWSGGWLRQLTDSKAMLLACGLAATVLAAREAKLISFPLPQRRRETEGRWPFRVGIIRGAALWGLHIGLGYRTWVNYGGFFSLNMVILSHGGPVYGALLMSSYWLGRALSAWVAPALSPPRGGDTLLFIRDIKAAQPVLSFLHTCGLLWIAGISVAMLVK